jgi:hypothetical protein
MQYPIRHEVCDLGFSHSIHDLPDKKHSLRFAYRYNPKMPGKRSYRWILFTSDDFMSIERGDSKHANIQECIADYYSQFPETLSPSPQGAD